MWTYWKSTDGHPWIYRDREVTEVTTATNNLGNRVHEWPKHCLGVEGAERWVPASCRMDFVLPRWVEQYQRKSEKTQRLQEEEERLKLRVEIDLSRFTYPPLEFTYRIYRWRSMATMVVAGAVVEPAVSESTHQWLGNGRSRRRLAYD